MTILVPLVNISLFFLAHYLAIGLLAVVGYLIGRRLTLRWSYHSTLEQFCFSVALGLGVIAYGVLALGLLSALYAWTALLTLAAAVALCYPVWRRWPRELAEMVARLKTWPARRFARALAFVLTGLVFLLPLALLALYPPTQHDATMYHLPYAKTYIQHHGLVATPNLRYIAAPQASEMLFTLSMLFYDDVLAQLTQFLMMMVTAAALIAFGQRYFNARAGWWAAAMWLGSPLVVWLGASAYVDIGVAFYVTMTLYGFWNWIAKRELGWLVLAGVFCGLAVGTKLLALFFLGVLGAVVLYQALKERRYGWPLAFGLVALLVALPWLERSFYYTGNPLYPFFHGTIGKSLGGETWRAEYTQNIFERIFTSRYRYRLQGFLLLPWNMIFAPRRTYPWAVSHIPITYLLAMPGVLVAFILGARFRWLLAFSAVYLPFWYFTIPDLRYLAPILPPLSLVIAKAADHLLQRLPSRRHWISQTAVATLGCILLISPSWFYSALKVYRSKWIPINQQQRDVYLADHLPTYGLYQQLNELKGQDYQIYAAFDERMAYFADGRFLGDWFGPYTYDRLMERRSSGRSPPPRGRGRRTIVLADGQTMYQALREFGADHLLVSMNERPVILPEDDFFLSHFKLIGARARGVLFELSEEPLRLASGANLIRNAGFEEVENGCPKAWDCIGKPVIEVTALQDSLGTVLVTARSLGSENVLRQVVPVNPGALYALSLKARAAVPEHQARLRIDWMDAQGGFLTTDAEVVTPGSEWHTYALKVSAPPGAVTATVYASGHNSGSIWFDDFQLVQLRYEPAN